MLLEAGATQSSAVYTADTMTLDQRGGSFEINDCDSLWDGKIFMTCTIRPTPHGNGTFRLWRARDLGDML